MTPLYLAFLTLLAVPTALVAVRAASVREARIAFTVLATSFGRWVLARCGQGHRAPLVLAGFWLCFYAAYFIVMSGRP